jgi:hypothetical protein
MEKANVKSDIDSLLDSILEQYPSFRKTNTLSEEQLVLMLHKVEKIYHNLVVYQYLASLPATLMFDEKDLSQKNQEEVKSVGREPLKPIAKTDEKQLQEPATNKAAIELEQIPSSIPAQGALSSSQANKRKDLKAVIGFNDRFLFTNQLFEGIANDFNEAIKQINEAENLDSAKQYVQSLQSFYNWDKDSETYQRFINIVEQVF